MKNIELKLELRDPKLAADIARHLGGSDWGVLQQTDTYFRTLSGRLKRRETLGWRGGASVEYIEYERPDRAVPRASSFQIYPEKLFLERFGTLPRQTECVVVKSRHLFVIRGTRIHIDRVESLGTFLEIEVSVVGKESPAYERLANIREQFSLALGQPLAAGYADLVQKAAAGRTDRPTGDTQ
ncbi:MAG: class IV adenylate cyclase [Planctomycetota bacterium]